MANIILQEAILRPVELDDIEALHIFRNDWDIVGSLGGFSIGYNRQAIESWVRDLNSKRDQIVWAIASLETNKCIGHIGLYNIDYRVAIAEVGLLIGDKSFWGRGIGSSVTRAIIEFGFMQLNLHRIQARILEFNTASIKMFDKIGLVKEGVMRDVQFRNGVYVNEIIMSILVDEWSQG